MNEIERLSCVVMAIVYGIVRLVGRWRGIVRTLIIGSVCYRKSLISVCGAL